MYVAYMCMYTYVYIMYVYVYVYVYIWVYTVGLMFNYFSCTKILLWFCNFIFYISI